MRHTFVKGKYFDPIVHQAKDSVEVGGQKTVVKATFISIPVFSSMRSQEPMPKHRHDYSFFRKPFRRLFYDEIYYHTTRDEHLANKEVRWHNDHPIRTLMQYANTLAMDSSRDLQQVVIKLGDDNSSRPPFIHVPEFWALVINMCKSSFVRYRNI